MFFEGDVGVLHSLLQKKALLATHDRRAANIRPLLLILGGTMRGVYGGGQVCALQAHGLTESFDVVVGISTGAPTAAYFLARQSALGTSIYHEECTTKRFMSLHWPPIRTDYLAELFRGREGVKRLDQDAIRASRSRFYIAATCAESGEGVLFDAKTVRPDIVQAVQASIAIPGFSGAPVAVGQRRYLDGGGAFPFPLRHVIERFNPTDVLVLTNEPLPNRNVVARWAQRKLDEVRYLLAATGKPAAVRDAFFTAKSRFLEEAGWIQKTRPPGVAVIWVDNPISSFERNQAKLRAASLQSERHLSGLLSDASGLSS